MVTPAPAPFPASPAFVPRCSIFLARSVVTVFKRRSERLGASIRGSVLRIIKDSGHTVHHLAPRQVAQAVEDVLASSASRRTARVRA
jgi:pimeloyl-ACP methyl ester carboxylesterase